MLTAQGESAPEVVVDLVVRGLEAEDEDGVRAVCRPGLLRLERVDQPQVRRPQARLGDRPHGVRAAEELAEAHRARAAVARPRLDAHPRLGDDAEDPLRSQQQPVGRRAGAGPGQPPALPEARGRDRPDGLDEVVDVRRAHGEVAPGAGGDPPAERRELEGLRVEAHRQAVGRELPFEPRPVRARADPRRERDRVDLVQGVERAQVERHSAAETVRDARLDAADDTRAAAVRDHRGVRRGRPLEQCLDLALVARARDKIRDVVVAPAERAHAIEVRLAVSVPGPVRGCGAAACGERARRP